jgi:Transposase DDE domain group 1
MKTINLAHERIQVKDFTATLRASHGNVGTAIPRADLVYEDSRRPVIQPGRLQLEVEPLSVTAHGGVSLVADLLRRFPVAKTIDGGVKVLKEHKPFFESDHVLAQALSLYVGGTCLEDMASVQHDEAFKRILRTWRLPDPTTAGDFLRRFDAALNPGALEALTRSVDEVQTLVHRALHSRKKRSSRTAVVDLDGHIKELYGVSKEGADFSHTGKWSYQALLCSMAETQECLGLALHSGNRPSFEGADKMLDQVLPRLQPHFGKILVRGDSDFDRGCVREACQRHRAYFPFVGREYKPRPALAEEIPEQDWKRYVPRAVRAREERARHPAYRKRKRKPDRRQQRARERGYSEMHTVGQCVAEVPYKASGAAAGARLVIRRQLIENRKGTQFLFVVWQYRYVVTNLPSSYTAEQVVDLVYQRCDQENTIAQMKSGLAAWRMPVAEFAGNAAWLQIARLAWNFGKWIAQLALPPETVRWEWKRFRQAFVHVAAQVVHHARQVYVRFAASHRFAHTLVHAHTRLQP